MEPETDQNSQTAQMAEPEPQATEQPVETSPSTETAQSGGDEPLGSSAVETTQTEVNSSSIDSSQPQSTPTSVSPEPSPVPSRNPLRTLLAKAQAAIQNRKRKKLDHIMSLFAKRTNITNDEVEKLLHVSDATATRYLEHLQNEGKIKQVGKTGKGVLYTKI